MKKDKHSNGRKTNYVWCSVAASLWTCTPVLNVSEVLHSLLVVTVVDAGGALVVIHGVFDIDKERACEPTCRCMYVCVRETWEGGGEGVEEREREREREREKEREGKKEGMCIYI